MSEQVTKAYKLPDGRLIIEQPDGTFREAKDKSDWNRVNSFTDAQIEAMATSDADALPTDEAHWKDAKLKLPPPKKYIHAGFDTDIVQFFKAQGRGYQTRMNAALRRFMEEHKEAG